MLNNLKDRNKMQINIHEQNINGETSTFITHVHFTKDFLELVNFLTMNFYFLHRKNCLTMKFLKIVIKQITWLQ